MTIPKVNCKYTQLVPIDQLKSHPKNPNKHTDEQIDLLAKLIEYQGWRLPIIVSTRSKLIVAGHGRLDAAKKLGLTQVPVDYQGFDTDDQELAFLTSDNAVAELSKVDLSIVNSFIPELGPDFDLETLGLLNFKVDASEFDLNAELEDAGIDDGDIKSGVKKGILIEFHIDEYRDALATINKLRSEMYPLGSKILRFLKDEYERNFVK